jgi:hypothetical protein
MARRVEERGAKSESFGNPKNAVAASERKAMLEVI